MDDDGLTVVKSSRLRNLCPNYVLFHSLVCACIVLPGHCCNTTFVVVGTIFSLFLLSATFSTQRQLHQLRLFSHISLSGDARVSNWLKPIKIPFKLHKRRGTALVNNFVRGNKSTYNHLSGRRARRSHQLADG